MTINTNSIIRDSTLFDLQGEVTSTLDFTNLNIDGSDLGKEGTDSNADLINLDMKSTNGVITMENWIISNSKFFQGFTMVNNPYSPFSE